MRVINLWLKTLTQKEYDLKLKDGVLDLTTLNKIERTALEVLTYGTNYLTAGDLEEINHYWNSDTDLRYLISLFNTMYLKPEEKIKPVVDFRFGIKEPIYLAEVYKSRVLVKYLLLPKTITNVELSTLDRGYHREMDDLKTLPFTFSMTGTSIPAEKSIVLSEKNVGRDLNRPPEISGKYIGDCWMTKEQMFINFGKNIYYWNKSTGTRRINTTNIPEVIDLITTVNSSTAVQANFTEMIRHNNIDKIGWVERTQ